MPFRIFRRCNSCRTRLWFGSVEICDPCAREIAALKERRELARQRTIERRQRWTKLHPYIAPRPDPIPERPLYGNPFYAVAGNASSIDADNPLQERRAATALLLSAYAGAGGDAIGGGAGGDFAPPERSPEGPAPACYAPATPSGGNGDTIPSPFSGSECYASPSGSDSGSPASPGGGGE